MLPSSQTKRHPKRSEGNDDYPSAALSGRNEMDPPTHMGRDGVVVDFSSCQAYKVSVIAPGDR